MTSIRNLFCLACGLTALPAMAASGPAVAGIQVDFILFADDAEDNINREQ